MPYGTKKLNKLLVRKIEIPVKQVLKKGKCLYVSMSLDVTIIQKSTFMKAQT